jgi:hypothetical protein
VNITCVSRMFTFRLKKFVAENGHLLENTMTDYMTELDTRATGLLARKAQSLDVDPADVFEGIDWTEDAANDAYFSKLILSKVIRPAELTRRKAKERAKGKLYAALGCVPGSPLEFVTALTNQLNVTADWKGVLHVVASFKRSST